MSEDKKNEIGSFLSNEILEEIRDDMNIEYATTLELKKLCMRSATLVQKYTEMYYNSNRQYKQLKRKLDMVFGRRFADIRLNGYKGIAITSNSDIAKLVCNDEKYAKLKVYTDDAESAVEFLDQTIKNFNTNAWKLKDLVEIEKLDNL
jgi:hypothetical protein